MWSVADGRWLSNGVHVRIAGALHFCIQISLNCGRCSFIANQVQQKFSCIIPAKHKYRAAREQVQNDAGKFVLVCDDTKTSVCLVVSVFPKES